MYIIAQYPSALGMLTLESDGEHITGLDFARQRYVRDPDGVRIPVQKVQKIPALQMAAEWLDEYFAGKQPVIRDLPLAPAGSSFRQSVWEILCHIPYGQVITYGEIAKELASRSAGGRMSAQAVGGAVGHNPISIIIPCHRVIGAKGNLTGFGGGMERKIWLLKHENVDMRGMFVPK